MSTTVTHVSEPETKKLRLTSEKAEVSDILFFYIYALDFLLSKIILIF